MIQRQEGVCGCSNAPAPRLAWRKDAIALFRCPECGLMWLDPIPVKDNVARFYTKQYFEEYYMCHREERIHFFECCLDNIESSMKPGKVLDVGCGVGLFIECAARRGWEAMGVEPSHEACELARNPAIREGTLESLALPPQYFDLITFWDVLVAVSSPLEQLRTARALLRPGGIVVTKNPMRNRMDVTIARALDLIGGGRGWLHLPSQVVQYSPSSLAKLFEATGFSVIDVRPSREPIGFNWVAYWKRPRVLAAKLLHCLLGILGHPESFLLMAKDTVTVIK